MCTKERLHFRDLGVEGEMLTPDQIKEKLPILNTEDLEVDIYKRSILLIPVCKFCGEC